MSESDCENLLQYFNVPDFLCNKTYTDLNGYFGCRGIYNQEAKLESYSTLILEPLLYRTLTKVQL
jgi:hypothetical protein